MKQFYLVLSLCIGTLNWVSAQQETTLSTMRSLPQATYTNPAFVPAQTFYLGLPGISSAAGYASTNSFSYKQYSDLGLEEDFSSSSLMSLREKLKDKNWIYAGGEMDLLAAGVRANARLYLRYRSSLKAYVRTMLPRDLALLADEQFLLKPMNVAISPSVQALTYLEHSFGGSYAIDPRLTVGANIKRLNGLVNIHTDHLDMTLRSRPSEGVLELEGGMLAYISGDQLIEEDGTEDLTEKEIRQILRKNGGWAVDLGATYQLTHKLQLGLGIIDFGTIKWGNGAREYRVNRAKATFESLYEEDEDEDDYRAEAFADTLEKYFEPQEKEISKYRTGIPTRTYLNATYQLHRSVQASGIFFAELYKGKLMPGFTAALHKDFGRRMGLAVSYTAINGSYSNIGGGFSFRLTPFQLYVVTDHLLGAIDYENAKNLNVRAGLNLVFGTIKKPTKLPY